GKRVRLSVASGPAAATLRQATAVRDVAPDPAGRRIPDLAWSPADPSMHASHAMPTTGGALRSLSGAPVSGSRKYVVLLCMFADVAAQPHTVAEYQAAFFGSAPGSVETYWREVSENRVDFTGSTVMNWVTMAHPRSYYFPNDATNADLGLLATDCTAAA